MSEIIFQRAGWWTIGDRNQMLYKVGNDQVLR
jgi:hypothetical protein